MRFDRILVAGTTIALFGLAQTALGVSVGQKDTFSNGTTENWSIRFFGANSPGGAPPPEAFPVNVPTGGPSGQNDSFLQLASLGGNDIPGSRLSVFNIGNQWAGDYIQAGVQSIRMDVNNVGQSELALRLLFGDPGAGPPQNVAISQDSVFVPAGSGWFTITFPIAPADLMALQGNAVSALTGATELRLFHSLDAEFPGEPLVAKIGVDNIEALGIAPVPDGGATFVLLSCSLAGIALLRRQSA